MSTLDGGPTMHLRHGKREAGKDEVDERSLPRVAKTVRHEIDSLLPTELPSARTVAFYSALFVTSYLVHNIINIAFVAPLDWPTHWVTQILTEFVGASAAFLAAVSLQKNEIAGAGPQRRWTMLWGTAIFLSILYGVAQLLWGYRGSNHHVVSTHPRASISLPEWFHTQFVLPFLPPLAVVLVGIFNGLPLVPTSFDQMFPARHTLAENDWNVIARSLSFVAGATYSMNKFLGPISAAGFFGYIGGMFKSSEIFISTLMSLSPAIGAMCLAFAPKPSDSGPVAGMSSRFLWMIGAGLVALNVLQLLPQFVRSEPIYTEMPCPHHQGHNCPVKEGDRTTFISFQQAWPLVADGAFNIALAAFSYALMSSNEVGNWLKNLINPLISAVEGGAEAVRAR